MFTATEEGGQLKHVTTLPHFWVEIIVVVSVIINHCITMITMIVIVIINYCHCHHKSSSLSSYIIVIVMITRWHRWLVLTSQATTWFSPTSRRAGDTSHHLYHLYHGRHSHRHYRHHCYHRHHHCHHHNHRHTIFEDNDEGSLQVGDFRNIHHICHFFSTWHIFGYNFSPHKKRVNRDKTDFTVKQRKPLINWFGNKTG